ncbi:hypothetical protein J2Z65_002768 [Paenibacillus aceris]|uniref:Paeninodin family lasso peptide n=1 Tax=Paenibacillus aceris TaxID=869555 RepID=A0ABS4I069_9BACL|nr:hypothetical protein [Paenibacillus aceris]
MKMALTEGKTKNWGMSESLIELSDEAYSTKTFSG